MSTNSTISYVHPDGKVSTRYCHADGMLEYNGAMLVEHYSDEEKIKKLMALGYLSFLGEEPIDEPKLWDLDFSRKYTGPACRTYRGRGDEDEDGYEYNSIDEYFEKMPEQEFNYIYFLGEWFWFSDYEYDEAFPPMKKVSRSLKGLAK